MDDTPQQQNLDRLTLLAKDWLARHDRPLPHLAKLTDWARLRHQQVEDGQLSFLARHLDLLVQRDLS